MSKELLIEKLEQFNYDYKEVKDYVIIKLDYAQIIEVDFSTEGKIKISDGFRGWNFLTGMFEMSIKSAMLLNFIGFFVVTFILLYTNEIFDTLNWSMMLIFFFSWIILWTLFYLTRAENMKRTLIQWLSSNNP